MNSRILIYLALHLLLSFVAIEGAWAQESKLPPCQQLNFLTRLQNNYFCKSRDGNGNTYFNGYTYFGKWQNGKQNGQGTATFANGDKYVGEFKDGIPNGRGTFTSANGDKYVGEVRNGKWDGQGTFTFGEGNWKGDQYVGEHKDYKKMVRGLTHMRMGTSM